MLRSHSIAIMLALGVPSRAEAALDIEAWHITTEPQPVPGDTEMLGPPRLDLRGFPLSSGGARRCDGTIGFHLSHVPTGVFFLDTAVWPSRPKDPDRPGLRDDYADQFSQPGSRDMGCGQSAVCQFVPVLSFMQEGPQGYELAEPPFDPAVSVIRVTWADDRLTDEFFHYEDVGRSQSYFFSEQSFAYIVYDADASSVTLHTPSGETEFLPGADAPRIWPRHTWFPHEIREFNGTNRPRVTTITYAEDEFPTEASREDELLWRIDWSEDHVAAITGPDSAYRFDLVYQESIHGRKQLVAQVFDDVGVRFGYNRDARPVAAQLWRNDDGAPKGPSRHAVKVDLDANGMVTKMTTPQFT
jgi:hypothetical protein